MKTVNRCLGVLLIIDAIICPVLILVGCYLWTHSGDYIAQRWAEYASTTTVNTSDDVSGNTLSPPAAPLQDPPPPLKSAQQDTDDHRILGVPQVMQDAWVAIDHGIKRMGQVMDTGLLDLKQVVAHSYAWQALLKLQLVLIAIIDLIGTYIYLVIAFFSWRLLKLAQLIRACYFVIYGEVPAHIRVLLSD